MPHPRTAEAGGASRLPRKTGCRRKAEITREWQDLHAMHDLTVSDSNNASWWQDIRTVYSPMAFYRAFWIHGAHILPKLAVFEYMPAICCHQEAFFAVHGPFGNVPRQFTAIVERSGMHQDDILPWLNAREHISATSCQDSSALHKLARMDEEHGVSLRRSH